MKTIKELNEAMKVLKEECEKHRACNNECPLYDKTRECTQCRVGAYPENYHLFEEADE